MKQKRFDYQENHNCVTCGCIIGQSPPGRCITIVRLQKGHRIHDRFTKARLSLIIEDRYWYCGACAPDYDVEVWLPEEPEPYQYLIECGNGNDFTLFTRTYRRVKSSLPES